MCVMRKKILPLILLLSGLLSCSTSEQTVSNVDYVNVLMGTDSDFSLSNGNTYPVMGMPWGMNFWTPQTGRMGDGWIYVYSARKIRGFRQTHQPSPWMNDYGQFAIMPVVGNVLPDEESRASWFSHKAEVASPYYYKVYLADYDVTTELVPTERCAMFRITYPETDSARIIIDAFDSGSYIKVVPEENRIVGYTTRNSGGVPENFKNYFVLEFDRPFSEISLYDGDTRLPAVDSVKAGHAMAAVGFKTCRGEVVTVRVSSSFISMEQAFLNMRELGNKDFATLQQEGRGRWNDVLGVVEVSDENLDHVRTFYSCLYRSTLFPRMFYEYDAAGKIWHYSPYDGKVHQGYMFTDMGTWDIFRGLMPLVNLLYPDMAAKMQEGFYNTYKESGFFPEWASPGHRDCMIGNNSASIVADACLKGLGVLDSFGMFEGLLACANANHPAVRATGRLGWEEYNTLGYVPYDRYNESAARTLEYAYDDWCIYQMGKALGYPEEKIAVYKERAANYRNLFDAQHKLMRGRNADGSFQAPFNPLKWGDAFTEGNSWHYTWSVFHDVKGLIDLMGGDSVFVHMLDSVFALPPVFDDSYYGFTIHEIREMQIMGVGNYAHGNQPVQHAIYLYDYAGCPWKTQYWVRRVMEDFYRPTPDGYCGDEDNGQTSAWFVFSAMGFYPVNPVSGEYAIGSPLFEDIRVHLQNGKTVSIEAPGNCTRTPYVKELDVSGKRYTRNYLDYQDLQKGMKLRFRMSDVPEYERGTSMSDRPSSMSD